MTTNLPPILDGVDHPDVCEAHGTFPTWREDGNAESGPGEPYLACDECCEEIEHPMIYCFRCKTHRKTVRMTTIQSRFDPTTAYVLDCGHFEL